MAFFSLAVETGYKEKRRTDFFNMTAFGKTAETMEKFVPKGTKINVECEARQNKYKNKDGNDIDTVGFTVLSFEFCEKKGSGSGGSANDSSNGTDSNRFMNVADSISEEELPFN